MAGTTGLEPAASAVTGQRSNQLNYVPTRQINKMRNKQCLCGFARFAYRAPVARDCPKERDSCPNRPQTASKFRHFRALLRFPKQSAQNAPGDPEFSQSGQNHQQNFRKSLSQKYPNSFSQNTKDHLHFPRVGLNEILKFGCNGDTSCLCDRAATSALSRQRPSLRPGLLFELAADPEPDSE
jgi:hypothetical protein